MLQNEPTLAIVAVDTEENERLKFGVNYSVYSFTSLPGTRPAHGIRPNRAEFLLQERLAAVCSTRLLTATTHHSETYQLVLGCVNIKLVIIRYDTDRPEVQVDKK